MLEYFLLGGLILALLTHSIISKTPLLAASLTSALEGLHMLKRIVPMLAGYLLAFTAFIQATNAQQDSVSTNAVQHTVSIGLVNFVEGRQSLATVDIGTIVDFSEYALIQGLSGNEVFTTARELD